MPKKSGLNRNIQQNSSSGAVIFVAGFSKKPRSPWIKRSDQRSLRQLPTPAPPPSSHPLPPTHLQHPPKCYTNALLLFVWSNSAHRDRSREWGRLKAKVEPQLSLGQGGLLHTMCVVIFVAQKQLIDTCMDSNLLEAASRLQRQSLLQPHVRHHQPLPHPPNLLHKSSAITCMVDVCSKAHRPLYYSTLGSRVIKKKKRAVTFVAQK